MPSISSSPQEEVGQSHLSRLRFWWFWYVLGCASIVVAVYVDVVAVYVVGAAAVFVVGAAAV